MNTLYNVAIIEGYLSQHAELPQTVREALKSLKEEANPKPVEVAPKKKRRMSKEWREKNRANLAKMRETRMNNIAAKRAAS